ncbi:hypothetical protein TanjilG_07287 [Lupinus angustifolius]|uniref:LOB domain-containing protein n=1 Tax=Lupinus angustifolius TaxID=3871 RepID=A0A1J7IKH9_LUPAN|nr:hypothetical protein TanjilG_07287 [Lupinus angustifolius]
MTRIAVFNNKVVNLQAELNYVHAHLATMHSLQIAHLSHPQISSSPTSFPSSSNAHDNISMHFDPHQQLQSTSLELCNILNPSHQQHKDGELEAMALEFVSRYLPGVRFKPPHSH